MAPIMSIKCRADNVEEGLFRRLQDMGIVRAYVGVKSGSDGSLRRMNKHTTVAQNRRALEALHQVGMLADFGLIFFDPDSTVEDVRANLDFFHAMAGGARRRSALAGWRSTPARRSWSACSARAGSAESYLAWNYAIADPRVELLFRLMIATMRHRHYDNNGLAKQCSIACYEWTMARYVLGHQANSALERQLQTIVAHANNHSLAMLEEMFDFTLHENIYDARLVNDQAATWASRINLFDLEMLAELDAWRKEMTRQVEQSAQSAGFSNLFGPTSTSRGDPAECHELPNLFGSRPVRLPRQVEESG